MTRNIFNYNWKGARYRSRLCFDNTRVYTVYQIETRKMFGWGKNIPGVVNKSLGMIIVDLL